MNVRTPLRCRLFGHDLFALSYTPHRWECTRKGCHLIVEEASA